MPRTPEAGPLTPPPPDFKDPSGEETTDKMINQAKLQEGADLEKAMEKALDDAEKQEIAPADPAALEQEKRLDVMFNEIASLEERKDVTEALEQKYQEAKAQGNAEEFLADVKVISGRFMDVTTGGNPDNIATQRYMPQMAELKVFSNQHTQTTEGIIEHSAPTLEDPKMTATEQLAETAPDPMDGEKTRMTPVAPYESGDVVASGPPPAELEEAEAEAETAADEDNIETAPSRQ